MKDASSPLNLSELTDFQFGPAWARPGAAPATDFTRLPRETRGEREERPRRRDGERRPFNREQRSDNGERRSFRGPRPERNGERRSFNRRDDNRSERPRRELPQPAEGFRVELRPANAILELFAAEIQKQKRTLPLLDLARVVMGAKNRYDLVFMKLDNGPVLLHSTKGDGACWLTKAEAVSYLWNAPWFSELYTAEDQEVEAPKGNFTSVAVCSMGNEPIGPANWHGYQAALMQLYRSKFSHMPLDVFKSRITTVHDEETVAAWVTSASHKTVWHPTREGATDTVLADAHAVEADFEANAFDSVYETVDKVFVNGATDRKCLSPGLYAHLSIMSDRYSRFPQTLIPNLCYGMARHHLPIFKWHGNHYTGPSRVRALPEGTVLADRMMSIVNWSKENSGKTCDQMFAQLSGVPAGTDDESKKAASEAYAPFVADMIWLLEQGFIVVTADNAVWFPKGEAAPQAEKKSQTTSKKNGRGNRKAASEKKAAPAAVAPEDKAPEEAVEKPAETPVAEAPAEASAESPAEASSEEIPAEQA